MVTGNPKPKQPIGHGRVASDEPLQLVSLARLNCDGTSPAPNQSLPHTI